jgi:MoaA/NifB/PqqE/SkfB family radical SAM enzyme
MQKSHLELKEIIWEITGRCNNGCKYCGSKDGWKEAVDEDRIRRIAQNIVAFPPKEIDISGGDPMLVSVETYSYLAQIFKDSGVKFKVLINPKSYLTVSEIDGSCRPDLHRFAYKLNFFDWVGISVNTAEEIKLFNTLHDHLKHKDIVTVVTNFNLENVFLFDQIQTAVNAKGLTWQIQYTIYNNENDSLGLYNNEPALTHFFHKLTTAKNNTRIVLADNLNNGKCGAGLNTLGVLSNGDIVPCLSMRSWKDIKETIVGNILESPLKDVWLAKFNDYRFNSFKCCKDHCKNKPFLPTPLSSLEESFPHPRVNMPYVEPQIMLYGVGEERDGNTYAYAVRGIPNITVYAVSTGEKHNLPYITTTSVDIMKEGWSNGQGK